MTQNLNLQDFVWNSADNALYGFYYNLSYPNRSVITRVSIPSGTATSAIVTTIVTDVSEISGSMEDRFVYNMEAAYMDIENNVYMISRAGQIYKVRLDLDSTGKGISAVFTKLSTTDQIANADGACCRTLNTA